MADKNSVSQPGATSGEGEGNTPEYVTKDELNQMLNGFRKSSKTDLESVVQKSIQAALAGLAQPKEEVEPTTTSRGKPDPEKEELKKQVKMLLERQSQADAEAARLRVHTALRDTFTKHGVDPRHVEHAIAFAQHSNLVKTDEDGQITMRVNQIDMPLTDAVQHWVKTDDAKLYLAPRGTQGSGQRGPVRPETQPTSTSPKQITQDNFGEVVLEGLMERLSV